MNGSFDLARKLLADSNAVFEELGPTLANAATSHIEAVADMLAGQPAAAETSLRAALDALERMGEQAFLSTTIAFLAGAVFTQERDDEAEELAQLSARLTAPGDSLTQILWRGVEARIVARRGLRRRPRSWRELRSRSRTGPTSWSSAAMPGSTLRRFSRTGAHGRGRSRRGPGVASA